MLCVWHGLVMLFIISLCCIVCYVAHELRTYKCSVGKFEHARPKF
jgi:hypothetical protein